MTSRGGARRRPAPPRLLSLILAVAAAGAAGCDPRPDPSPSVLLIVVDTLRADRLGIYGHSRPTTPHLDRRAADAAVFDHAYSTSSWTLPAIGSILTGRLPRSHGARALDAGSPVGDTDLEPVAHHGKSFARLRAGVPTLAERLAEIGYDTAAITSNPFLDSRFGLDRGFAVYDQESRRRAPAVTDRALAWLETSSDEPFFLFVHYMDPHLPYRPPGEHRGRFTAGLAKSEVDYAVAGVQSIRAALPGLSQAARDFLSAAYDEEIAFVDSEIERLLAGLQTRGALDDTLVLLTSDHGEELFEHGGFEHGHSMYDEVLRVPLLVWGPGVEPGRRSLPVSLADIAPTVMAAAGGSKRTLPEAAGVSLVPALAGGPATSPPRTLVAQDLLHGPDELAAIEWPHKVIVRPGDSDVELFDLSSDPSESENLALHGPAPALRLLARARAAAERMAEPGEEIELDGGTLGELRALGYID